MKPKVSRKDASGSYTTIHIPLVVKGLTKLNIDSLPGDRLSEFPYPLTQQTPTRGFLCRFCRPDVEG